MTRKHIKIGVLAVWFFFKSIFRFIYLLVALPILLVVSYFFGYPYLQSLKGNDTFYHLTNVFWYSRFFPHVPYWYPLQNGGVVPIWGYPSLSYFIVIIIHLLSAISLPGVFQLLGFFSVPLVALGMYFFVWFRLRNQTMGLIAAVFYILMPMTWVWLFDWGFYTESISYIFIFPTLIFYDYFLGVYLRGKYHVLSRLSFLVAVLFSGILFLAHPSSFFVMFTVAFALTLFQVLDKQRRPVLDTIKKIIVPFGFFAVFSLLIISFLSLDFYAYSNRVAPSGPAANEKAEFLKGYATPVDSFLGLAKIPATDFKYGHRNIVVPPAVWVAAAVGLLFAVLYSRKVLALALLAAAPVIFFKWPIIVYYLGKLPLASYVLPHRTILIFARILMPIAAAFGTWVVVKFILDIPTFWIRKGVLLHIRKSITAIITSVVSLGIAAFLIVYFSNQPAALWHPTDIRYGPQVVDIRDPFAKQKVSDSCSDKLSTDVTRPKACNLSFIRKNLDLDLFISECGGLPKSQVPPICLSVLHGTVTEDEFNSFRSTCHSSASPLCGYIKEVNYPKFISYVSNPNNWPRPNLTNSLDSNLTRFSPFILSHNDPMLRIDVSPYLGGVVQTLNVQSDITQINLYAIQLSLLEPYWGYEQQVFFSKSMGGTVNVNNLAKYFGIQYLFMDNQLDPLTKYQNDKTHWKEVDKAGIWQFTDATKMYSWTSHKPTVLVIGSAKQRAYEPFFRASMNGGYNYADGTLVQGKQNIDDYSVDELKKFDTIVLFGYSYHNQGAAFNRLDQYVKDGGNLFISTGWQYTDKDWQLTDTPAFLPVSGLHWTDSIGKDSTYTLDDSVTTGVDVSQIPPLVWSGQGWGVSVPNSVRNWGKTLVSMDGKPLVVAGQYGNGKVLWTGMNWPGHLNAFNYNKDELALFHGLMTWFGTPQSDEEMSQSAQVSALRVSPDHVEFTFNNSAPGLSTFYWRESMYSNWHATLISPTGGHTAVQIYRAGPGFMLMRLPDVAQGSKLVLEFLPGLRTYFGYFLTFLSLFILLLYCVLGTRIFAFFGKFTSPFVERGKHRVKKVSLTIIGDDKKEEEDY